ncbi:MAG TPA: circadian clock KaiB family protein [Terriglobales bacterium]|nr:circadian clock KaiB family protein [Terriglobales bacterium]
MKKRSRSAVRMMPPPKYVLRLYVTGTTALSQLAIGNLDTLCREYLRDRYELEIIDVYQRPSLAREQDIVAAPTLIKLLPLPIRRFIGDLSDKEHVLLGMDIKPEDEHGPPDEKNGVR